MATSQQFYSSKEQVKRASKITLFSLLNLTFLPVISFIWLVIQRGKSTDNAIEKYYLSFSIYLNLIAAVILGVVTALMFILGGFDSAWTWVYVITYFTLVHTIFILLAVWAMTRAWSGKKLKDK